jgi:hypothetical protein
VAGRQTGKCRFQSNQLGSCKNERRFIVQSDLRLREFLNNIPGGYPETESGVELRILEKFFTPERGVI